MHPSVTLSLLSAVATLVSACAAPPATSPPPAPTAAPVATAAPATGPPTFVNRVWRVADASARASDQLYVFLSEGTLVFASSTGTPALGRWSRAGDGLIMIEAGRSHPTDIVSLTADEFRIRSHNPGQPVDIRLVPADREPSGATP